MLINKIKPEKNLERGYSDITIFGKNVEVTVEPINQRVCPHSFTDSPAKANKHLKKLKYKAGNTIGDNSSNSSGLPETQMGTHIAR